MLFNNANNKICNRLVNGSKPKQIGEIKEDNNSRHTSVNVFNLNENASYPRMRVFISLNHLLHKSMDSRLRGNDRTKTKLIKVIKNDKDF